MLPISLPSKNHALQVQNAEDAQGIHRWEGTISGITPTSTALKKNTTKPLRTDKLHLTFSDGIISIPLQYG